MSALAARPTTTTTLRPLPLIAALLPRGPAVCLSISSQRDVSPACNSCLQPLQGCLPSFHLCPSLFSRSLLTPHILSFSNKVFFINSWRISCNIFCSNSFPQLLPDPPFPSYTPTFRACIHISSLLSSPFPLLLSLPHLPSVFLPLKKHVEDNLCWLTTPGFKAFPRARSVHLVSHRGANLFSLPWQQSNADGSLGKAHT